jgi:hypothetical protein
MSRKAALSGGAKHPRRVPPPRTRGAHRAEATGPAKPGRQAWLLAPALVLAVLTAYYPAWHGGPVWDDEGHLTRAELRSVEGLRRIWFEPGATQQYYPVVHSAFWIQHRIWGDDTLGYHLVSIALHSLSALLVAAILRRLAVPGAWLAAVIFALHPVHVESVAWISELKNTLSGVFYLACALAYLQFDESRQPRQYALAMIFFILALLSKTVTATLPASVLVVLWWRRGTLSAGRDVRPLVPFFVLGAAAGLLTTWVERTVIGASGPEFDLTPLERVLIAGRAIPFYLWKLFWPFELVFNYPRWAVDPRAWLQYLFPAGVLALVVTGSMAHTDASDPDGAAPVLRSACSGARLLDRVSVQVFVRGRPFPVPGEHPHPGIGRRRPDTARRAPGDQLPGRKGCAAAGPGRTAGHPHVAPESRLRQRRNALPRDARVQPFVVDGPQQPGPAPGR